MRRCAISISMALSLFACSETDSQTDPAGTSPDVPALDTPANGAAPAPSSGPTDADPDGSADPGAPSPGDDPAMPPATQEQLVKTFAPRLHLHPSDTYRPANVDWFLARVSLRFAHPDCASHEVLGLGKVTQTTLVAASHASNGAGCAHDAAKVAKSTASDAFYLDIANDTTRSGAPRAEWKTYVVWRPRSAPSGLVDIEYWTFYPWNDGFSIFDHPSDWEHVRTTIDPRANGGQGKLVEVKLSAHKGGTILKAGDSKLKMDGTHPISYVAKGTHANYAAPGTYDIDGTYGIAKDEAKAAPSADVWKQETSIVIVGTRAAPKSNQVFVKYWGRWGEPSDLPEASGVTRHFP